MAGGVAPVVDKQNAFDLFQGLLAIACLTGSNIDEARGSCKKCGRVGFLTFLCKFIYLLIFFTEKTQAAVAATLKKKNRRRELEGGRAFDWG